MITLIAAVADDGTIGKGGNLPWRLPADLARFKERTLGHTLIMGRKTWASIGRPLPKRRTVVLTRSEFPLPAGVERARDLDEALRLAGDDEEVFIAGGEAVYRAALPIAKRLDLTRVHTVVEGGDARFPPFDEDAFRCLERTHFPADDNNPHARTVEVWERLAAA